MLEWVFYSFNNGWQNFPRERSFILNAKKKGSYLFWQRRTINKPSIISFHGGLFLAFLKEKPTLLCSLFVLGKEKEHNMIWWSVYFSCLNNSLASHLSLEIVVCLSLGKITCSDAELYTKGFWSFSCKVQRNLSANDLLSLIPNQLSCDSWNCWLFKVR